MQNKTEPLVSPLANYHHDHPPVRDVNALNEEGQTTGQRVADRMTALVGSWPFIIIQSILLAIWILFNIYFALHPSRWKAYDPYPFILLNLALSFQAAYTGPIVMMSQNRQTNIDRLMAQSDYECNTTAEQEVRLLMEHMQYQDRLLLEIREQLNQLQMKQSG